MISVKGQNRGAYPKLALCTILVGEINRKIRVIARSNSEAKTVPPRYQKPGGKATQENMIASLTGSIFTMDCLEQHQIDRALAREGKTVE